MQFSKERPATGHVFRVERKKGAVWFAKYRLPNGRQVKKKIGPAHTGRGRPPAGTYTERTANEWLRDVLRQAEAKTLPGAACPDVTFADAAREWLRYGTEERACKPSTVRSYRSSVEGRLIPAFGDWRLEEITARDLERWRATLTTSPRTKNKLLTELYGIFKRAQKVYGAQPRRRGREAARAAPRRTPGAHARGGARAVPRGSQRAGRRDLPDRGVYRPAPRRADRPCAGATSFTASRIRVTVSLSASQLSTPKSGKERSVPMAREVAVALALIAQRAHFTGDDDLVFPGTSGGYLDGDALSRRYAKALRRAGLRACASTTCATSSGPR